VRVVPRSLAGAALLPLAAACAQMDPPPGGPEDRVGPYVVAQRPDSLAIVPGFNGPVVIEFSERISEQRVEESVMVSPRTSPVAIDRGSRSIRVSLRRGWEPGQIYHVAVGAIVQDLFNNPLQQPVQVVFSTGPAIPATRLTGTVRDRISGEPEEDVRVEAIRTADSLVYAVPSDSAGQFIFAHVPEGEYLLRAFPDANRNRELDVFEERDSVQAAITTVDTAQVELRLVMPDSTPPAIDNVSAGAERRVEVRFDDYLDPAQQVDPAAVTITGPGGEAVAVASVTIGEPPETSPDTAQAAADTLEAAGPRLPSRDLVVLLAEGVELTPEVEYGVAVTGMRNVVGLVGDSQETFTAPEPPEPPPVPDDAEQLEQPAEQPQQAVPPPQQPPAR
jgi:hypothetical protein